MLGYKRSREFNTSKPTEKKIAIKNFGAMLSTLKLKYLSLIETSFL